MTSAAAGRRAAPARSEGATPPRGGWPNRNIAWAAVFVDELARAGVRDVCISPGSRSAPLVLAVAEDDRFRKFTHVDERSAGFFALGLAKASGQPAAVVTTSGTAAANLYPAVIEACQGEVPLLLITADRPHDLRDADANQAIDQVRLYGPYVRAFHEVAPPSMAERSLRHLRSLAARAVASTLGSPAGPVHLNFPFAKPLEPTPVPGDVPADLAQRAPLAARGRPDGNPFTRITRRRPAPDARELEDLISLLGRSPKGLIVCGPASEPDRTGPAALELARVTGYPLLADPFSGARFNPGAAGEALTAYDLFLAQRALAGALAPDMVLRLGASPTSANLCRFLEENAQARQIVVDPGGRYKDHLAAATDYVQADAALLCHKLAQRSGFVADKTWAAAWQDAETRARRVIERELRAAPFEGTALAETARAVPSHGTLFVSNSMPARDLDSFAAPRDDRLLALGNRGASGIDGVVSSAIGAAVASEAPTIAVLGDLALYHDMNGLLALRNAKPDLVMVVINNDGGGIFNMLPIRQYEPAFTRHFATPHGLDLARVAALYDLPFERVANPDALGRAILEALEPGGPRLLEVSSDRETNRVRHEEVMSAVAGALDATRSSGGTP